MPLVTIVVLDELNKKTGANAIESVANKQVTFGMSRVAPTIVWQDMGHNLGTIAIQVPLAWTGLETWDELEAQ